MKSTARALFRILPVGVRQSLKDLLVDRLKIYDGGGKPSNAIFRRPSFTTSISGYERLFVKDLERYVVGGFSSTFLQYGDEVLFSSRLDREELATLVWMLACHHFSRGDNVKALYCLAIARSASPKDFGERSWLLALLALRREGREGAARRLVTELHTKTRTPELGFALAAFVGRESTGEALEILNQYYRPWGLAPLSLSAGEGELSLDSIVAPPPDLAFEGPQPLVSVIMPAFNCGSTLQKAAQSVLMQSWRKLELIIVDDASADNTLEVAQSLAEGDHRVKVIARTSNDGAYACRNTGLDAASGTYITVLDSDDWAHPERIEHQVKAALKGALPNYTFGIRIETDFVPELSQIRGSRAFSGTLSSYLFDRSILRELGGWLPLKVAADDELITRYARYTDTSATAVLPEVPMTLVRASTDTLTRSHSPTDLLSLRVGARRELREAYLAWHRSCRDQQSLRVSPGQIPFGVPNICRATPLPGRKYDVCYLSDFSMAGGTTADNVSMILAGQEAGLSQAIYHWPRIDNAGRPKNPKFDPFILDQSVDQIVAGEEIECRLLVVSHPRVLAAIPDRIASIKSDASVIIMNQAPTTRSVDGMRVYSIDGILKNFERAFSHQPLMAPLSPLIRRLMREEGVSADQMTEDDWVPILDLDGWKRPLPPVRDGKPVAGRHSRDDKDKWPDDVQDLGDAHCAGSEIDFRILGGARVATQRLGRTPSNWTIHPFDTMSAKEFLHGLDFYVYFTQEHMYEAFGRAPMEAMATGMPVILPPRFEEVFEDGAIYAEARDVPSVIRSLWADREAYVAQVQRGWAYVERHCSQQRFLSRLDRYIRPDQHH